LCEKQVKKLLLSFILNSPRLRPRAVKLIHKFQLGNYKHRLALGAVDRPNYGYCVYNAALLAKKLGHQRISVLEFGVAGGNGLLNLECHAQEVFRSLGVEVEIFGFDTGEGLPQPIDYRDLPYHWKKGFFKMDVPKLQSKLKQARLVLGNVEHTSKTFFAEYKPAPIGAIIYDLDFYSSTAAALKMLEADPKHYLPRVFSYFDDTIGSEIELYNDYTGQRLAINEFNQTHDKIKLGIPYHFLREEYPQSWHQQIWICHFLEHSRYNDFVSEENQNLHCQ
jgi:hypothetical protein